MADLTDKDADKKMCLVKNFVFEITDKAEVEMVHRMSRLNFDRLTTWLTDTVHLVVQLLPVLLVDRVSISSA